MKNYILITFGALLLIVSSCRVQKDLVYFQRLGNADIINETTADEKAYRIRTNDILYIRVITQNDEINQMFQQLQGTTSGGGVQYFSDAGMYYTGYSVNDDGYVKIPMLGSVRVEGYTAEEARDRIQEKADELLNDAIIITRLANFRVTFLGEVRGPGSYTFYHNQTTILEAVGQAGDLTDYADRRQVLIIRPTVTGSQTYRVNIQDPSLLASSAYFIQPNDIIYVPPLPTKGIRLLATDLGMLLGTATTVISSATLIITLLLALQKTP